MGEDFDDPQRVAINRVYTGVGDGGRTALVGGQKVPKTDARIRAYGTVDELNAFVGMAAVEVVRALASPHDGETRAELDRLSRDLGRVQQQLFNLGSILATLPEDVHPRQPRIRESDARWLEEEMDRCNGRLEPLRTFVLPGGSPLAAALHVCRTVARRAEREVCALGEDSEVDADSLVYLNRLSDAFFVWSRHANRILDADEVLWRPDAASES